MEPWEPRHSEQSSSHHDAVVHKRRSAKMKFPTAISHRPVLTLAVLSTIATLACAINVWLVSSDTRPQTWDYADYLATSVRIRNALLRGSLPQLISVLASPYRPPLIPLAAQPFYAVFGVSPSTAMLVNVLFILILIVGSYLLARHLSESSLVGLVASGIVSTLPGVMISSRVFGVDFPTAALVPIAIYFAVSSNGFRRPFHGPG